MPEPGVEQVQHGVLRPADVEIDRHPGLFHRRIDQGLVVLRIEEAEIVPARAGPLRHGVRLAAVALAVERDIEPRLGGLVQRRLGAVVGRVELHHLGQVQRQVFAASGRGSGRWAGRVVQLAEDRERLAPEMLPAEEPVAELVVHRRAAQALGGQVGGDPLLELGRRQAVVGAAVDGMAFVGEGLVKLPAFEVRDSSPLFAPVPARKSTARSATSLGITTGTIGSSNFCANSKSRSSCAGTAMIAPVP